MVSLGFGLWMDYDWRKKGWDEKNVSKNYFTPEQFGGSVRHAMKSADEFVWVYTESPKWWTEKGPEKLPPEYQRVIEAARR